MFAHIVISVIIFEWRFLTNDICRALLTFVAMINTSLCIKSTFVRTFFIITEQLRISNTRTNSEIHEQNWQLLAYCVISSMVSCQKGPTRHAYAWQIGPFSQDTFDISNIFTITAFQRQHKAAIAMWCLSNANKMISIPEVEHNSHGNEQMFLYLHCVD